MNSFQVDPEMANIPISPYFEAVARIVETLGDMKFKWGVLRGKFQGGQGVNSDLVEFQSEYTEILKCFQTQMRNLLLAGESVDSPVYAIYWQTYENTSASINADFLHFGKIARIKIEISNLQAEEARLQNELALKRKEESHFSGLNPEIKEKLSSIGYFSVNTLFPLEFNNSMIKYQKAVLKAEIEFIVDQLSLAHSEKAEKMYRLNVLQQACVSGKPSMNSSVKESPSETVQGHVMASSAPPANLTETLPIAEESASQIKSDLKDLQSASPVSHSMTPLGCEESSTEIVDSNQSIVQTSPVDLANQSFSVSAIDSVKSTKDETAISVDEIRMMDELYCGPVDDDTGQDDVSNSAPLADAVVTINSESTASGGFTNEDNLTGGAGKDPGVSQKPGKEAQWQGTPPNEIDSKFEPLLQVQSQLDKQSESCELGRPPDSEMSELPENPSTRLTAQFEVIDAKDVIDVARIDSSLAPWPDPSSYLQKESLLLY